MKKLIIAAVIVLGIVAATSESKASYPKPPPGCGTDSNGVKYCCNAWGQCWAENWTPQ